MLHYVEGASIELKAQEKVPFRNREYQPFGCVVWHSVQLCTYVSIILKSAIILLTQYIVTMIMHSLKQIISSTDVVSQAQGER